MKHGFPVIAVMAVMLVWTPAVRCVAAGSGDEFPSAWLAAAEKQIRLSEYELSWSDALADQGVPPGDQAPNRAHGFRTYFGCDGLTMVPRVGEVADWTLGLGARAVGRDGEMDRLPASSPQVDRNTASYLRSSMTEVYRNDTDGLHQEIELLVRPDGDGRAQLRMRLDGDLSVHRIRGDLLELRRDGVSVLRYGWLQAVDADGRRLVATVEIDMARRELIWEVDDADALYPVRISASVKGLPVVYDWMAEGNQADAQFASSVATAGDVNGDGYSDVIIGAPYYDDGTTNNGKVFVYRGYNGFLDTTPWWTKAGLQTGEHFGHVVGTAGDVNGDGRSDVFVGSPYWDEVGKVDVGKVYVYHGGIGGLSASADWTALGEEGGDLFGWSVSTGGTVNCDEYSDLIVGAPYWDFGDLPEDDGQVYVYYGSSGGLSPLPSWTATSGDINTQFFGYVVATAGDIHGNGCDDILVGNPYHPGGGSARGCVYIYPGSPADPVHSEYPFWCGMQDYESFGQALATAGDTNGDGYADFVVGAPGHTEGVTNSGAVFYFWGDSAGANISHYLRFDGLHENGQYGAEVAAAGDVNGDGYGDFLVGEPWYDGSRGKAYVITGSEEGPGFMQTWATTGGVGGDWYGRSLATAGDVNGDGYSDVIVGAPQQHHPDSDEGVAYIFYGGPDEMRTDSSWYAISSITGDNTGFSVASADVNGDGLSDMIVGAPYCSRGLSEEGCVFVWYGSGVVGPPQSMPDWYVHGGQAGARLGWSVASAGDVNGDGYADIIAGAPEWDSSETDSGAAFMWLGQVGGLANSGSSPVGVAHWAAYVAKADAFFGGSVAGIGDVNGDGYGDVAVGALDFSNPDSSEGAVFVWHGGQAGMAGQGSLANADWSWEGGSTLARMGTSVAGAGDVNGDGFSDLIVGSPGGAIGIVAGWYGSSTGLKTGTVDWIVTGHLLSFGSSVAGAGDVNGDGYSDVVVGSPLESAGSDFEGVAYAYCGGSGGLGTSPCWKDEGVWAGDDGSNTDLYFGFSVASAGDLNADGYADITVGAPGWDYGYDLDVGQTRVYFGSSYGLTSFNGGDWSSNGTVAGEKHGNSVTGAGDINGDGFADLLVGTPGVSPSGRALVFAGNGHFGLRANPRQMQPFNSSRSISPLGASSSENYFEILMEGQCPTGYSTMRVLTEVRPLGDPFTAYSATWWSSPVTDVGLTSIRTSSFELVPDTVYHWRSRLAFSLVRSPFAPPRGRWLHSLINGWEEADFRTPSPGGGTLIFADGFETGNTSGWSSAAQ